MYEGGLLEETAGLIERFGEDCPLLETIGYGEARRQLRGELEPAAARALTELRTRRYAKRQRTWFRRRHDPLWLAGKDESGDVGSELLQQALSAARTVLG
jgi:tRNA dimethylallyltransferase